MASRSVRLKGGRMLDQTLIDKLGAEAEQGYDLSHAKRVFIREGRPARGEQTGESPRVASRIPRAIYLAAKKRAERDGLTVSELVRGLVAGYAAGQSSGAIASVRPARVAKSSSGRKSVVRRKGIAISRRAASSEPRGAAP